MTSIMYSRLKHSSTKSEFQSTDSKEYDKQISRTVVQMNQKLGDSKSLGDSFKSKADSQEIVERREFQSKLKQPTRHGKNMNRYNSDADLDPEPTFISDIKPTKTRYPLRRED